MYANAHIDGEVVAALNSAGNEPFWKQAFTSVIHRIRVAAVQAGNPEPTVRETAALLDNEIVLDGLFHAAIAKSGATETEDRDIAGWLNHDWRGLDYNLQNAIREGIRNAGTSKLTVRRLRANAAPTAIGDRRGDWIDNGKLLWDTSSLPREMQETIQATAHEILEQPETGNMRIAAHRLSTAGLRIIDTIESAITAAKSLEILTAVEHERYKDDMRKWRDRIERRSEAA